MEIISTNEGLALPLKIAEVFKANKSSTIKKVILDAVWLEAVWKQKIRFLFSVTP